MLSCSEYTTSALPEEKASKPRGFRAAQQWHFHAGTFCPVFKAAEFDTDVHTASEGEEEPAEHRLLALGSQRDAAAAAQGLQAGFGCGHGELHLQLQRAQNISKSSKIHLSSQQRARSLCMQLQLL